MKNPTVSIIIPVYNAEGTITRCLDSIIHQTYSSIKGIGYDDYYVPIITGSILLILCIVISIAIINKKQIS